MCVSLAILCLSAESRWGRTCVAQDAEISPRQSFAEAFSPLLRIVSGTEGSFECRVTASGPIDGQTQQIQGRLTCWEGIGFDLELSHQDYALSIHRRRNVTAMALPKHRVVYWGSGDIDPEDHLDPERILDRLVSSGSQVKPFVPVVFSGDSTVLATALETLLQLKPAAPPLSWASELGSELSVRTSDDMTTQVYSVLHDDWSVEFTPGPVPAATEIESLLADDWKSWKQTPISRIELEQTLCRGVRRALEVLAPSGRLTQPRQVAAAVPHGELRWVDGHRLVLLRGTPEQVGRAHGQLLKSQSMACVDSVLHAFGTVQTVINGRWFRHDLEEAYRRLKPHIPEDHLVETRALATSLGLPEETMEVLNVFPELFHCSGFAVFGDATQDGKLYHGRVLDYMTMIGLQDAATTFVIMVEGKQPFATIGYAGFTGSVSGMNLAQVSLGEMGGRGEGQWDGVPMATLMRRALEECETLAEVIDLWQRSPRTCEYYYVFADGKDRSAVGVAATPDRLELVYPGQGHPLLGPGIKDAVLLSAGDRLELLRQRVSDEYGKIDAVAACKLMSRPVAMSSNLHNVLFVPEDRVFWVANASHDGPAAEQPYVPYDLGMLVEEMQQIARPVAAK